MKKVFHENPILVIVIILVLVACFDFFNMDKNSYDFVCKLTNTIFKLTCSNYYDLPIWQVSATFGSLAALYFAYRAITQSNLQLEIEQTPYVVMKGSIGMVDNNQRMHVVMFENIGKGLAANITLTVDPEAKISVIESSNPHTVNLGSGQYNNGWAVDEDQVIKGLKLQGKNITRSVIMDMPDEKTSSNVDDCDFHLYYWYEDQTGKKYQTKTKIRRSGFFLKVMENKVRRL